LRRLVGALQCLQCRDHLAARGQGGGTGIGPELALPAEPHHDDGRQNAQHQLGNDGRDPERRTVTSLGLEHHAVHKVPDDPRKENHEGVHHSLNQRQRHHVAIGHVADFMGQHSLSFLAGHGLQQAGAYGDQGAVA
jgi:hypothetical protein